MKWNVMIGTLVAVGMLGAAQVRAEDAAAQTEASAPARQNDKAPSADPAPAYGTYVDGPATVDADGVPVAKPNAMSKFMKQDKAFNDTEVEMPLVDETNSSSGQTK